jgi:hypothetical protein
MQSRYLKLSSASWAIETPIELEEVCGWATAMQVDETVAAKARPGIEIVATQLLKKKDGYFKKAYYMASCEMKSIASSLSSYLETLHRTSFLL